jgi:hypothetical protein
MNNKKIMNNDILCLKLSEAEITQCIYEIDNNMNYQDNIKDFKINMNNDNNIVGVELSNTNIFTQEFDLAEEEDEDEKYCMWDTCTFTHKSIGIPTSFNLNKKEYMSIGCFCSTSCAAAFNATDCRISSHVKFERNALINMLHDDISNQLLKFAPSRECLNRYGGNLTIEQFRKSNATKSYIVYPPFRQIKSYQSSTEIKKRDTDDISNSISEWAIILSKIKKNNNFSQSKKKGLGKFIDLS